MSLNLLVLSPYDAQSHSYWRRELVSSLQENREVMVTEVTLPARHFSWRFRGNSLTLSQDSRLLQDFDLIIATSMTDFATLLGLRPNLAGVPSVLYFHENQFAYPEQLPERQVERQITSIYSALAATRLAFNSEFNRSTFLAGSKALLGKMPDGVPADLETQLAVKSEVIAVPISMPVSMLEESETKPHIRTIVWNHRWEHDKGLDELEYIVDRLLEQQPDFRFHLIGQSFRQIPREIERIREKLGDHLGEFGYVESRMDYLQLLKSSHIVLSTARHEFQGLAVLEAMAAGCAPVVPDGLAYQELIAERCRYENLDQAAEMIFAEYQSPSMPHQVSREFVSQAWNELLGRLLSPES